MCVLGYGPPPPELDVGVPTQNRMHPWVDQIRFAPTGMDLTPYIGTFRHQSQPVRLVDFAHPHVWLPKGAELWLKGPTSQSQASKKAASHKHGCPFGETN